MARDPARKSRAFTLIELLVVVVLIAIVLAIGVPSFTNYIVTNRLKAVTAQLVTDLQFARSEAMARSTPVFFSYRNVLGANGMTCYILFTSTSGSGDCNCQQNPGSRCVAAGLTELRTHQVGVREKVRFNLGSGQNSIFAFDSVNGGIFYYTNDYSTARGQAQIVESVVIGDISGRKLRMTLSPAGRPSVCSAGSKLVAGYPIC
jgi:type IV fimbrial biogenesis protein FimT